MVVPKGWALALLLAILVALIVACEHENQVKDPLAEVVVKKEIGEADSNCVLRIWARLKYQPERPWKLYCVKDRASWKELKVGDKFR